MKKPDRKRLIHLQNARSARRLRDKDVHARCYSNLERPSFPDLRKMPSTQRLKTTGAIFKGTNKKKARFVRWLEGGD